VNARRRTSPALSAAAIAALLCASSPSPVEAKLVGGRVEHRPGPDPAAAIAGLARGGKGSPTVWLAWSVPARGRETICGFGRNWRSSNGSDGWGITLGEEESSWGTRDNVPPIGVTRVEIYAAVRDGQVRQLQFASGGCPVAAGDHTVVWLDGVEPKASVALLAGFAERRGRTEGKEDLPERALAGLAFHADPEGPLALVHLAREGRETELRSQSLFWLSQTNEPRAARWIREAIGRDPDGEVREQGVFALSQLDDGASHLLAVLRESRDREVKRQAIFWLGQSDDPRAIAELERLLTR
jgi:hypothetical protein